VRLRELAPLSVAGWKGRRYAVRLDGQVEAPVLLLEPEGSATRRAPVAVLIGGRDSTAGTLAARAPWVRALREAGFAVVLADVRYTGELDRGATWRELYGRFFGLDEGILAVRDLRAVLDAVAVLPEVDPRRCAVVGFAEHGAVALLAAALDARIGAVVAPELGPLYRERPRAPAISRILLHGDLDDAAAAVAPRLVLLGGVADPGDWPAGTATTGARAPAEAVAALAARR
jgi:poly(3-hydroxybutyrate) depolymerase